MYKFNFTYQQLTEALLIYKPEFLLTSNYNVTKDKDFKINQDGSVDIFWNINIKKSLVKDGKFIFKFNFVDGIFNCTSVDLTTLEGCPQKLTSSFYCSDNKLTSLKYAPEYIQGNFHCSKNYLETLEYCPKVVEYNFVCTNNKSKQFTKKEVRDVCKVRQDVIVKFDY